MILFQDFGLDVESFRQMVGDCPPYFFNLTVVCCSVRPLIYYHERSYINTDAPQQKSYNDSNA